jgi:hypothetical protein
MAGNNVAPDAYGSAMIGAKICSTIGRNACIGRVARLPSLRRQSGVSTG